MSVLPFPTHMVAEYLRNENAERIAVTVYGLNLLAISAFTSLTWHYALAEHLVRQDNSEEDVRAISAEARPQPGVLCRRDRHRAAVAQVPRWCSIWSSRCS